MKIIFQQLSPTELSNRIIWDKNVIEERNKKFEKEYYKAEIKNALTLKRMDI